MRAPRSRRCSPNFSPTKASSLRKLAAPIGTLLKPSGMLILNSGTGAHGIGMLLRLVKPLVLSPFVSHSLRRYLSMPNHEDLDVIKQLVETGKLRPVIDKVYSLEETPEALRYIEGGHAKGKVVVGMEPISGDGVR